MVIRRASSQTRRKILDVALELFTCQGYDRTSLREISERLGFSKAALYYHFKAKEDILYALAGTLIDEAERLAKETVATADRPLPARVTLLERLLKLLIDNRATAELLLSERQPMPSTDFGERIGRLSVLLNQALMPPKPTAEDRVRAAAALAIIQSTLHNLSDVSSAFLRGLVLRLAAFAIGDEGYHNPAGQPRDTATAETTDDGDDVTDYVFHKDPVTGAADLFSASTGDTNGASTSEIDQLGTAP